MDGSFFKLCGAFLLATVASFFQQYGLVTAFVIVVILLDFATGLIKAKISGEGWESKKGTRGFWKKVALLCALSFGIFLDAFIPLVLEIGFSVSMPFNIPIGMVVAVYIILNESISITENLYCCNSEIIPKWIASFLKLAKDSVDRTENKSEDENV